MATNQFPPFQPSLPPDFGLKQTITSSGAVTIPSSVTQIYAVLIGGGGGGGGSGGGGGAGGYSGAGGGGGGLLYLYY